MRSTLSFAKIFHALDPDVFVDNHVSNGAELPIRLDLYKFSKRKLAPSLNNIIYDGLLPNLEKNLKENHNIDLFPYVDLKGKTPNEGIVLNDLPRYAMGYGSLFHS